MKFPARLSRRMTFALAVVIALVLLGGGVSVFLAVSIRRNQDAGAQEYSHTISLAQIDSLFDTIISKLQQMAVTGKSEWMADAQSLQRDLRQHLEAFRDLHLKEAGLTWNAQERMAFADLWGLADELQSLIEAMRARPSRNRRLPLQDIERMSSIMREVPKKVEVLSELHRVQSVKLMQDSQSRLGSIVGLYLVFTIAGSILIVVAGWTFHQRIALPLRRLADAALGIAEGHTDQRVTIRSQDEFGQVSQAFNLMVDRLEQRDREIVDLHLGLQDSFLKRTQELEETTRRFISSQEALARSQRAALVGQIAAAVTHGVRTPLSALAINLQLLQRALDRQVFSPERVQPLVSTANLEVDRINRTLEEFFHYARLPKPRFTTVDCNALVRQIAAFLHGQAEAAHVSVALRLVEGLPSIQADGDQLREALGNLSSNAIQAMPDGGQLSFETLSADDDQMKRIMVRISDSGVGISPETLPHIFEPFFSTKGRGLGLGLPIALRIAEEHGGTIHCRSKDGEGTSFEVVLPLTPPEHPSGPNAKN